MRARHTPGPWRLVGGVKDVGGDDLYYGCIEPDDPAGPWRGVICRIQSADHLQGIPIGREEAEANGRWIVAAHVAVGGVSAEALEAGIITDMLRALIGLRHWVAQLEDDGALDDLKNAADDVLANISACYLCGRPVDVSETHCYDCVDTLLEIDLEEATGEEAPHG